MKQTFREWIEQELAEEEKWFTASNGHKMAYDPKTGKITKGQHTGSFLDWAKEKIKKFKDDRDTEKAVEKLRDLKKKADSLPYYKRATAGLA